MKIGGTMKYLRPLLFAVCLLLAFMLGTLWRTNKTSAESPRAAGIPTPIVPPGRIAQIPKSGQTGTSKSSTGETTPTPESVIPPGGQPAPGYACTAVTPVGSTGATASVVCFGNISGNGTPQMLFANLYNSNSTSSCWTYAVYQQSGYSISTAYSNQYNYCMQ